MRAAARRIPAVLLLALVGLLLAAAVIESLAARAVHPRPPLTRDAGPRNVALRRRPYDWGEHGD